MPGRWSSKPIEGVPSGLIIFDGVCVFCSHWVRFVIERDAAETLRFLAIQSDRGERLAVELGIDPQQPETNAVILDGVAWFKSDAALMVLNSLPGWGWIRLAWLCPKPIRDFVYDRIARNRYRIFGRTDACMVPTPELKRRFLDLPVP